LGLFSLASSGRLWQGIHRSCWLVALALFTSFFSLLTTLFAAAAAAALLQTPLRAPRKVASAASRRRS
jgi:hypothetical protein